MKKIFTLIAMAMMAVASNAQSLQFCYEDGTIIPDGSVIVVDTPDAEALEWDEIMFNSGIFIKNTSASEMNSTLDFSITELAEESELSVCLGMTCKMYSEVGEYSITNVSLEAGGVYSMQCHWVPAYNNDTDEYVYGNCFGEYTLKSDADKCSTITVKFVYADPTGINSASNDVKVVKTYDIQGREAANAKGMVIEKMSDGSVRKVIK